MRSAVSLLSAVALVAIVGLAQARTAFAADTPFNAKGTLVDVMCGEGITSQDKADAHTKACALSAHCAASGFGVFVDGKFHKFDAEGNKKAKSIFESSKKTDHITATVTGTLEDDGTVKVASITAD